VPTNIANPMLNLVIPEFLNGKFNNNNLLSIVFNLNPMYSFLIFIFLFAASAVFLDRWYKKLVRADNL
jgi:hypothetical protein